MCCVFSFAAAAAVAAVVVAVAVRALIIVGIILRLFHVLVPGFVLVNALSLLMKLILPKC